MARQWEEEEDVLWKAFKKKQLADLQGAEEGPWEWQKTTQRKGGKTEKKKEKAPRGIIHLDCSGVIFFNCTIAFSLARHLVFITDPLHPL